MKVINYKHKFKNVKKKIVPQNNKGMLEWLNLWDTAGTFVSMLFHYIYMEWKGVYANLPQIVGLILYHNWYKQGSTNKVNTMNCLLVSQKRYTIINIGKNKFNG